MGVVAGVDVGSGLVGVGRDTSRHSSSERSLIGCLLNITTALHCFTVVLPITCDYLTVAERPVYTFIGARTIILGITLGIIIGLILGLTFGIILDSIRGLYSPQRPEHGSSFLHIIGIVAFFIIILVVVVLLTFMA